MVLQCCGGTGSSLESWAGSINCGGWDDTPGWFPGSCRQSSALQLYAIAQIGTYQTDPLATYAAYDRSEVQVQASLPLELMALASFACLARLLPGVLSLCVLFRFFLNGW